MQGITCRASHAKRTRARLEARVSRALHVDEDGVLRQLHRVHVQVAAGLLRCDQPQHRVARVPAGARSLLSGAPLSAPQRRCLPQSAAHMRLPHAYTCSASAHALHGNVERTLPQHAQRPPAHSRHAASQAPRVCNSGSAGAAPGRDLAGLQREGRARLWARDLIVLRGPRPAAARQHTSARRSLLAVQCR